MPSATRPTVNVVGEISAVIIRNRTTQRSQQWSVFVPHGQPVAVPLHEIRSPSYRGFERVRPQREGVRTIHSPGLRGFPGKVGADIGDSARNRKAEIEVIVVPGPNKLAIRKIQQPLPAVPERWLMLVDNPHPGQVAHQGDRVRVENHPFKVGIVLRGSHGQHAAHASVAAVSCGKEGDFRRHCATPSSCTSGHFPMGHSLVLNPAFSGRKQPHREQRSLFRSGQVEQMPNRPSTCSVVAMPAPSATCAATALAKFATCFHIGGSFGLSRLSQESTVRPYSFIVS